MCDALGCRLVLGPEWSTVKRYTLRGHCETKSGEPSSILQRGFMPAHAYNVFRSTDDLQRRGIDGTQLAVKQVRRALIPVWCSDNYLVKFVLRAIVLRALLTGPVRSRVSMSAPAVIKDRGADAML